MMRYICKISLHERNSPLCAIKRKKHFVRLYCANIFFSFKRYNDESIIHSCSFNLILMLLSIAVRRFHSLFHSLWSVCIERLNLCQKQKLWKQRYMCWKGTFHHSLTVLVCYRFPLHKKHQYLAFDVSLPPPCNLSCSPKQLDSDNDDSEEMCIECANVAVTLYGDGYQVAFQRNYAGLSCTLHIHIV